MKKFYNTIHLSFTFGCNKQHNLSGLMASVKHRGDEELVKVFQQNTDKEKCLFKLIIDACIESSYNPDFIISKEDFSFPLSLKRKCSATLQSAFVNRRLKSMER